MKFFAIYKKGPFGTEPFILFCMTKKISQISFGNGWGLIGSLEKTDVQAVVGAVSDDLDLRIGLTAMQLDNLGYGTISVQSYDKNSTPVEVHNAFGENAQDGSKIWISRGLAEKMELRPGEVLKLHRTLDEQGMIHCDFESQDDNPFGQDWGMIKQPVEGIVAAIDNADCGVESYRVGLSAMQIANLGIERISEPLNNLTLMRIIIANELGLSDGQDYENLIVEFEGHKKPAIVYNAFGMSAIDGCGVRVSSTLAENLGLKLEDKVKLYTK